MNPEMSDFIMLVMLWQSFSDILEINDTGDASASDSSWDEVFTSSPKASETRAKHSWVYVLSEPTCLSAPKNWKVINSTWHEDSNKLCRWKINVLREISVSVLDRVYDVVYNMLLQIANYLLVDIKWDEYVDMD